VNRRAKIVCTLGPAVDGTERIRELVAAGMDVARLNFSHGEHEEHQQRYAWVREAAAALQKPVGILADLQGPKIRLGRFAEGSVYWANGETVVITGEDVEGTHDRVSCTYEKLPEEVRVGDRLLIDDGKVRLKIAAVEPGKIGAIVEVGGKVSNHKGVNVPDVLVPIPALTEKDRSDLQFALEQGADYIALSFVQRPEDVAEARELIGDRAGILSKIEKPQAIERLDEILKLSDAVMVARGDLGVELPPESVPPLQNKIVARARQLGKPVVVATQMLESMIVSPTPTRAEVSDVATAIYDGADAVMLSAESAAGQYPVEAVLMMDRIGCNVERDPVYAARIHFTETLPEATAADALADASYSIATNLKTGPMVCYTSSGSTARRIARERPPVKILAMTASLEVARRLGLQWGVHAVHTRDVASFEEMVAKAKRMALRHKLASANERLVILAGVPFKTAGSTNVLHVVRLVGDELEKYEADLKGRQSD